MKAKALLVYSEEHYTKALELMEGCPVSITDKKLHIMKPHSVKYCSPRRLKKVYVLDYTAKYRGYGVDTYEIVLRHINKYKITLPEVFIGTILRNYE